jgi:hypothetical protein
VRIPNCGLLPADIEAAIALSVSPGPDVQRPVPHSPAHAEFKAQLERAINRLQIEHERLTGYRDGEFGCQEVDLAVERLDEVRLRLHQRLLENGSV